MTGQKERWLTNARLRCVLGGIDEVIGTTGLNLVLRRSKLERYTGKLPPDNEQPAVLAAEYAALHAAIEEYYGRGSRGSLTRIGQAAFRRRVAARPLAARLERLLLRLLPPDRRKLRSLQRLAAALSGPDGGGSAHQDDRLFLLVDPVSDATRGRSSDAPLCWLTVGEIQEALRWATGQEHEVVEVACRAAGAPACRFEISPPPG
ncbi:MAG: hypothetical protein HY784_04110 [Chloroflexi bacterium]|nr:hypothetical protein [Chloroflexota bacterium]